MIHQPLSPDGVHRQICLSLRLFVLWFCSSGLVRHILLFVYFFKELISFTDALDKCYTSVLNALIRLFIALPVTHLSDAPRRRLVVKGDSARIQDETTESSAWFFNVLDV